jgi:HlyD family secretion protein
LIWDYDQLVKSPIEGVVSEIFRQSAGPIQRGEPIFEVSGLTELEVVVELLTPDAIRLRPRGPAKILNWGGKGELEAHITQISRAGMVKVSALGVEEERTEVRLSFDALPAEIKSRFGDTYHVDVTFIVSQAPEAITVPLGALFKTGDQWAVYVVQNSKARLKKIKTSLKNSSTALVSEGLDEGELVILFPGDKIQDGIAVRIKK